MIQFDNHTISAITYSGHTIIKVYGGCSEYPIWEATPPQPTEWKLKMDFTDGRSAYLPCDSTSAITSAEVQTNHVAYEDGNAYYERLSAMTSVTIGSCVTLIGTSAFKGLTNLQRVFSYGENVEEIGLYAFSGCTNLSSIYIGCSTKIIGAEAFRGCTSVSAINICAGVETIGMAAFMGVSSFSGTLTIPATVTTIGNQAFYGMTNTTRFNVNPSTPPSLNNNNYAFHLNASTPTSAPIYVKTLSTYRTATGWREYVNNLQQL